MAEFLITAPGGKQYKVTGATREGALAALKKQLGTQQSPKPFDTSMGTAFRIGDLEAQSAGAQGRAALGRLADDSVFGDVLRFGRENIANPVREALGFDPINQDAIESKLQSDALKKAEAAQAASKKLQEETNFKNLTTDDIDSVPSFVNFVTQKLAQSGPQMLAAIGSGGYVTYPFMVGELTEAQKNLEGLTQEEKDRTAALGGLVMTALENLGIAKLLPKGTSTSIIGGIANGSISEGTTEGLQELIKIGVEYNAGKKFAEGEVLNRLKEAAAAGASSGGTIKGGVNTATKVSKIFTSDGKVNQPGDLDSDSAKAAGDFARRLRTIADANGYDLKDVGAGSTKGARETVDKAHIQMSEELKKLFRDLGGAVKPTDLETYIETADKILAQAAYREARNKTKSTVGQQEIDAMRRLVGNTAEGQQAINLMLQLNQLTEVHNEGYKGGLSRFTDVFNPFDQNINSYDGASRVVTGTLSPLATIAGAVSTGGTSVVPQAGAYGAGRAIDKLTGRRSRLDRFVRRNERNEGLPDPTGPSLVEAERIRKQQEQDEALRAQAEKEAQAEADETKRQEREAEKRALNLDLTKKNAPPTPDSPQFTMEDATGLNRDGVARILRVLKGSNKSKALTRAITEYEQSVATGGTIENKMLSPLIRAVRQFQEENPDYAPRVRPPNALSNSQAASAPNAGGQTYGPQYTTPENYNRGIQNNIDANRAALEGVIGDPDLNQAQKAQLATSLDVLATNLGADPVAAAEAQIVKLQEAGVPQDAIDAYVKPYVDRVIGQQAPRQSTSRLAEMEADADRLSMNYKDVTQRIPELQEGQRKLQANEITKEEYEQLVNKYKPVMPYTTTPEPETVDDATYALSNGKGQSEAKAAKYGLPSKELKEGERVQLRLDIPSYSQHGTWVVSVHRSNSSPDSTAESRFKAGPVVGYESVGRIKNADLGMLQGPAQKIASGSAKGTIATMLGDYVPMTPQEASQYVEEVLPRTLEPGSGYAQVGMDPERHSYFYDRNTMEPIVSASDIVQIGPLVVAKDPVYGPKSDFRFSKRPALSSMDDGSLPVNVSMLPSPMQMAMLPEQEQGIPSNDGEIAEASGEVRQSSRPIIPALASAISNAFQRPNPGPSARRPAPGDGEIRQQYSTARIPFEVGKPGTDLENGIKNIEQLNRLAEAYNVNLIAYRSQRRMLKELAPGFKMDPGTAGLYNPGMNAAGYLVPGAKRKDGGAISANESFITAVHELAHAVADKQADGSLAPFNVRMFNRLTNEESTISQNSFDYHVGIILGKSSKEMDAIRNEIIRLQDKVHFTFPDGGTIPTRDLAAFEARYEELAKVRDEKFRRKWAPLVRDHRNYVRNINEMAVDPLSWYLFDPKAFKKEAPKTAKMMREFFNEAGSIKFYNHPLAMGVAVILAMLMQADQDDEQKRMMPPGALNQPMQAGALSA